MAQAAYTFYRLSDTSAEKLGIDPIPFPVRAGHAKSIFESKSDSVPIDRLLDELDRFLLDHPDLVERYAPNAARLAMICASRHVSRNDFPAALDALDVGLRADPQHRSLKAHRALALQVMGDHSAAATSYEQLLQQAPHAFDPMLRALAAKAFAAGGDQAKAREILAFLPEQTFEDPSLRELRASLQKPQTKGGRANIAAAPVATDAQSTNSPATTQRFCTECRNTLRPDAKFCTRCRAPVAP